VALGVLLQNGRGVWHWIDGITMFFSNIPFAYREDVQLSLTFLVIYYIALACAAILVMRLQGRTWRQVWQ
jgi:hypothetical protein